MSHLTVSYVSLTPAGTPAGATAAAAPTANGPLGFLGALLDQLLAGGPGTAADHSAGTSAAVDIPGLLNATLQNRTEIGADKADFASSVLGPLVAHLDQLAARSDAGAATAPSGELRTIGAAVDALLAALGSATPPVRNATVATGAASASGAPIPDAAITQLLTSLGLAEPQAARPEDAPALAAKPETQTDIAALRERLTALARSVAATAPELAQKLQTLAARLEPVAADPALAAQLGLTAPAPDADVATIAHIIRSLLGHADIAEDGPTSGKPQAGPLPVEHNSTPQVQSDLIQVLATLGGDAPPAAAAPSPQQPAAVAAASGTTATAAVPPPLLRLSAQLGQVAAALASAAPDLARTLETVATRLVSPEAGTELLSKLASAAAAPGGTALDRLVQALIEPKPLASAAPTLAAPQIAAPKDLPLPAPIAPKPSKSAVAEVKAAPPEPAPATADSAPRPAPNVTVSATAQATTGDPAPEPRAEARIASAPDAVKSDPASPQLPTQTQPAAALAQQARPLPAAYQAAANPINMGQMAFEMVRQVHQGTSRFTIRLDPPELGRVDVKLHVDTSGALSARLTVDRAETLDLFQRDRQHLERALAQAGLDTSRTNLEFSLRQQHHNPFAGMMGGDRHRQQAGFGGGPHSGPAAGDGIVPVPAVTLYRGTASAGGVNIFA